MRIGYFYIEKYNFIIVESKKYILSIYVNQQLFHNLLGTVGQIQALSGWVGSWFWAAVLMVLATFPINRSVRRLFHSEDNENTDK